jgi:alkylation response protein AidB-like acyl-CoA dehydrogenase
VDFEFSDEQEALRTTVRDYLAARAPVSPYVRAQLDTASGTDDETWDGLAELGVTGLLVGERHGGAGTGMVDMAVVLEEMGRVVHPGPFLSTAVSGASLLDLLARHDPGCAPLARGVASGATRVTVATARGSADLPSPSRPTDRLTGTVASVPDAAGADVLLVTGDDGAGPAVWVVERSAPGVEVTPEPTVDGTRRFATLELRAAPGRRVDAPADGVAAALAEVADRTLVGHVVDGVGAAERALELAVEHARARVQFGRPIGSFQAVQHLCADMLQAVELGRAAAYYACWACDAADPAERERAVAIAAAYAGDALYGVGASAIQVLGGIGFTWEHDAHLYYKRLLTLQQAGGPPHAHLERLASIVLD